MLLSTIFLYHLFVSIINNTPSIGERFGDDEVTAADDNDQMKKTKSV